MGRARSTVEASRRCVCYYSAIMNVKMTPNLPSPTAIGRAAEVLAADHLINRGYTILDRNWRNRWCEIDLVARRADRIHFVEVKYRRSSRYGAPAEYISYDKSNRLIRAAAAWTQAHGYAGPCQIDVMAVTGPLAGPVIEQLENVIEA